MILYSPLSLEAGLKLHIFLKVKPMLEYVPQPYFIEHYCPSWEMSVKVSVGDPLLMESSLGPGLFVCLCLVRLETFNLNS